MWRPQTLQRFAVSGEGPTGWRRSVQLTRRVSAWSTAPDPERGQGVKLMNELGPRGEWMSISPEQFAFYLHVDDGVTAVSGFNSSKTMADDTMHSLADALEDVGLVVPDRHPAGDVDKIIGYSPRDAPARLELPPVKAVLLRDALDFLADDDFVDTTLLRGFGVSLGVGGPSSEGRLGHSPNDLRAPRSASRYRAAVVGLGSP